MLLVPIPWAQRVWALPFLTVLAPSERYYEDRVRRAKKLTDWVWQVLLQVRQQFCGYFVTGARTTLDRTHHDGRALSA